MEILIAHLFGDYVLQNHYMANRKTSSSLVCMVHVVLYTACYAVAIGAGAIECSWWALVPIAVTHFFIDRFRLAKYWVQFFGIGVGNSTLRQWWCGLTGRGEQNRREAELHPDNAPPFLAVWLLIIVDNSWHLCINAVAIAVLV
jgi:hypothetical protein